MQTNRIIENILVRELRAICDTCVHRHECVYRQASKKAIIQCELFEPDPGDSSSPTPRHGLCTTCDQADRCTLPGRVYGVWHCGEFT
ncbi:MAG TPA: hypothetical protein VEB86_08600 [Chryseosolibacter sp.]|nr:hypothetical protein [Chryseosolibacter sp.]